MRPDLADCAREIHDLLAGLFLALETNRDALARVWDECAATKGGAPAVSDLSALGNQWHEQLTRLTYLDGMGFIAAPRALADVEQHIEWRRRIPGEGMIRRYEFDVDPRSARRYDYDSRAYFSQPQRGRRVVDGPYLDYLATHAYILTFGVPVVADGSFVGVSAADVQLHDFERVVMPVLRRAGRVALLNRDGRVVLSSVAAASSGQRLSTGIGRDDGADVPIGEDDIGWRLREL